jgi:glucosamine--fructose-6-phosphate aminotransferase (isomerizing)
MIFALIRGEAISDLQAGLSELADAMDQTLTASIDSQLPKALAEAPMLYFAGRNNGVAEELTLKTNEITRKKSSFLEGTYAVHGIEEVMRAKEALIMIDPFEAEEEKFEECLVTGAGLSAVAISDRQTRFPTIILPKIDPEFAPYLQMAAGWSLLLETGLDLGINLDKPERARKVGNEYTQ